VFAPVAGELGEVDELLHGVVAESQGSLSPLLGHVLANGKRLRAALVLLSGRLFDRGPAPPPLLELAAAVEILHAATLVHDDIVDQSPYRRGRQTLHQLTPAAVSVLAGDLLLARAVSRVTGIGDDRITRIFADTIARMCEGQISESLQAHRAAAASSSEAGDERSRYFVVIEQKTSALCAASCTMPALLMGATADQREAMRIYGLNLGFAFQIVDDVLDFTGDAGTLGKPTGSDLRQGLLTLPSILYLEENTARRTGGPDDRAGGNAVLRYLAGERTEQALRRAVRAVAASSAIDSAIAESRRRMEIGRVALLTLPSGVMRDALLSLSRTITERRR